MVTKTAATPEASLERQKIAKLLDQYGCGPVRFSGTNDALYERHLLAEAVASGQVERGVARCGKGVGASVCTNKVPGIRADLIPDHFSARQGVEDDHVNIICLGDRTIGVSSGLVFGSNVCDSRVQRRRPAPANAGTSRYPGATRREK